MKEKNDLIHKIFWTLYIFRRILYFIFFIIGLVLAAREANAVEMNVYYFIAYLVIVFMSIGLLIVDVKGEEENDSNN